MARETTTEKISVAKPVSYADLDLSKPADVEKLKQRVRQAAQDACGQLHSRFPQTLNPDLGEPDCVSAATDKAMAQLDGRGVAAR
jgi:UrcA family protein